MNKSGLININKRIALMDKSNLMIKSALRVVKYALIMIKSG